VDGGGARLKDQSRLGDRFPKRCWRCTALHWKEDGSISMERWKGKKSERIATAECPLGPTQNNKKKKRLLRNNPHKYIQYSTYASSRRPPSCTAASSIRIVFVVPCIFLGGVFTALVPRLRHRPIFHWAERAKSLRSATFCI
jgi:hypothetical protein